MVLSSAIATMLLTAFYVSGAAVDFISGRPLSGFTVTVGQVPDNATCLAAQTATSQPCGVPAAPVAAVITGASGAFSINVPSAGTYMLTIGKDGTYATLHRTVLVGRGIDAPGLVRVSALSADEQAWLKDVNHQRATVSAPRSYSNLVVDEYAQEQARRWAVDVAAGKTRFTDEAYARYQTAYATYGGSLYETTGVLASYQNYRSLSYLDADASWLSEKANCPGGNWQTCTFTENTGHYINFSNTNIVWVGLGENMLKFGGYASGFFDLMLIESAGPPGFAALHEPSAQ